MQSTEPLTFGSLFAGIGGLDLGLERAGMVCKWQCEIDDYATRVLAKHWPDVPKFRDVRSVGADNLPAVDLICGGFPCQDISNAGQRAGITGERSGLWTEYARIIRELRPRYVLVENVSALLIRGLSTVLGDLAALRYDAEWECIPAFAVGAPHRRDRVFVVAYTHQSERQTRCCNSLGVAAPSQSPTRASGALPDTHDPRLAFGQGSHRPQGARTAPNRCGWWNVEPGVGRVVDGFPARVDRLRGLGNAVVPQVAEFVGQQIVAFEEARYAK
jgi:DNA (cytosine-5)-methyltransferase 1